MDLENQQILVPPTSLSRLSRLTSSSSALNLNIHNFDDHGDDHGHSSQAGSSPEEGCPYPRPFFILDLAWNLGFVFVAGVVLLTTITEKPSTPLRIWIAGYALQCFFHALFLWFDHQRPPFYHSPFSLLCHRSFIKRLESVNTVISSVWWVFGFYWIYMGGHALWQDSPRLYWLSVVFLAFDVFFMIFCIAMACVVFVFLVCCFPVLARVAYAMNIGDGASDDDIRTLPKYKYCRPKVSGAFRDCNKKQDDSGSNNYDVPELVLGVEDSVSL
ncbi:OLC1v1038288C1 [Oldenlandia corymbosa var. corymbosa]|uniref:OLC1v1038288C1 n=1 Tax=Oldenlandia corymbosa var. corymbosa TaxID=529605 RepID=A0AAV1D2I2_OLDCO|nr:OLC1v1038288C1 [Oldenlandia corymbosa var. corymbosa]